MSQAHDLYEQRLAENEKLREKILYHELWILESKLAEQRAKTALAELLLNQAKGELK